jgi:type I restriction enzyme S subunit
MKSGEGITAAQIDEFSPYPCYGGNGLRGYTRRFTHEGDYALIGRQGALCGNVTGARGRFYASEHAVVVAAKANTDIHFLTYVLDKLRLNQYSESSAQPGLSVSRILKLPIAAPSTLGEQRAIATALSNVDALLGVLDRLIAKKRDLKQAAMQRLLTGETRLPGFSGDWANARLGDLGTFLKGSGVRKDEARSGDLPCVRYGELYTHHNDYIRSFYSWISAEVASGATRLVLGDLLFTGSGETKEEIGKCVAFVQACEAYAGGDIVILRARDTNPLFMGYYCNTPVIAKQKGSRGQGDAVVHISAAELGSIRVRLPSIDEQAAIAAVLSDMDAEIDALRSRRAKTHDLKRAMMQELLAGKTRLVKPTAAHA